nr:hypothetical protein BaRGS_017321 [Batillaria attramentaria]
MLANHGLRQLVDCPTQRCGHTLDWVIVREEDSLVSLHEVREYPNTTDHYAVVCRLAIASPPPPSRLVTSRNLRGVDPEEFQADVRSVVNSAREQPPDDVDSLVACYDDGLRQALDRHAPLVTRRVRDRPSAPWLFESSAYRSGHSTETAVLSVVGELLSNADERLVSLVALLDLSAAFDTLDHSILLRRLETTFGFRGTVLTCFDRTYKYDITKALEKAHLDARDQFTFQLTITALNGTVLDSHLLKDPTVIFQPATHAPGDYQVPANMVRKDLSRLSERDIMSLKSAMHDLQDDEGKLGWQVGHALKNHGSAVAVPYWDWTLPMDHLPELFTEETYYDAWKDEVFLNPFSRGYVKEVDGYTVRDPQPELWKLSKDGQHSVLFDEVLLALEQEDFCDFEVQFEVTHNAIHYLVGGHQTYALSSLHYSSYDPIFFVHHSFVDKIWAVWQELQKRRHKSHDRADCAVNFMHEPMHPFDNTDLNPDPIIRANAVPQKVFNYVGLGYKYDNLDIGGKSLDELEDLIHEHQSHPRVFAGFHLQGIHTSADVVFSICKNGVGTNCTRAGAFFILGGDKEMAWSFDRVYKYEITDALHDAHIAPEDVFDTHAPFQLVYEVHDVSGKRLPDKVISAPTIIFEPARGADPGEKSHATAGRSIRKNINDLTSAEIQSLKDSLQKVIDAPGMNYQRLASWHGWPGLCEHNGRKVACCHHGMASFPGWHRLYVRMLELVMTWQGAQIGLPYWDWTESFTELPALVTDDDHNPFHSGVVEALHETTSRAPRPQLFKDPELGEESFFYRQILLAFEQRDFCDFEVQFEVTHNAIHSWIGGSSPYGMSTLEYSAYDPIFFLHHANVDRQFAIWQALQKYRGLDYNSANCNIQELLMPLEPFNWDVNPIIVVRDYARGIDAFNYEQYSYQYDDLNFHGMTIAELEELLEERRHEDRVFLNFMLHVSCFL